MKYTYKPDDENDDTDRDRKADATGDNDSSSGYGNRPNTEETVLGIDENIVGALTYLLGWITGVAFLLIEKENRFVRFHAIQSIAISVPLTIASMIFSAIGLHFLGTSPASLLNIAGILVFLFLMFQAFIGMRFKFPYAGDFAEEQIKKMDSK